MTHPPAGELQNTPVSCFIVPLVDRGRTHSPPATKRPKTRPSQCGGCSAKTYSWTHSIKFVGNFQTIAPEFVAKAFFLASGAASRTVRASSSPERLVKQLNRPYCGRTSLPQVHLDITAVHLLISQICETRNIDPLSRGAASSRTVLHFFCATEKRHSGSFRKSPALSGDWGIIPL